MSEGRTAALIVNARSRSGHESFEDAQRLLAEAGIRVTFCRAVRKPGQLQTIVAEAVREAPDLLIVGGGDGSLSSAVDQLVGTKIVFALLPLGTANSFARSLGIPVDLPGAIKVIAEGRATPIDLGMIDGDYFCNVAAIGLAPQIAETIPPRLKKLAGRVGYLSWAAISLARFEAFTLIVDGEAMEATEVRIANGRFQGGAELVDAADPQSGEIVVQAVRGRTRFGLIKSWTASILRLPHRHATTREFHGSKLRIETIPRLPISIDGEVLAHTPVTARVAPSVIRMMLPT